MEQGLAEGGLRETTENGLVAPAIDLRELRYFVVLADELHFGRAAKRLHISQSPLSQAIAQLERRLGTRLLDRSSRYVKLTPAGEVLREHGIRLLRDATDAVAATRRTGAGQAGSLRIAAGPVTRQTILPALLHEVDLLLPDLTVEIAEDLFTDPRVDRLLRGAVDVAFALCAPAIPGIAAKLLRRDQAVAVVHMDHPLAENDEVTVEELASHTLVLWPHESASASHELVLSIFDRFPPAGVCTAELFSGAWWEAMTSGGITIVTASWPVSVEFVALQISDATAEFTTSIVWAYQTPPAILDELLQAADSAIAANGWL